MSLINPFPPRGEPDPVDVFLFFWMPFGCLAGPIVVAVIALVLIVIDWIL